jgi:hypothetical protein
MAAASAGNCSQLFVASLDWEVGGFDHAFKILNARLGGLKSTGYQ